MYNDAKWESFIGRGHGTFQMGSFIGSTKFKQRKRRVFMYILVVKLAVI